MFITKISLSGTLPIIFVILLSITAFGQQNQFYKQIFSDTKTSFQNPLLLKANGGCRLENLNNERFDKQIGTVQRIAFCEAFQDVSNRLRRPWSSALENELQQIWQVFVSENVKIHPLDKNMSSNIRAYAKAFSEDPTGRKFSAGLYLRPEKVTDQSFFLVLTHELRHIFDFYTFWKNKTSMSEYELEKRAFRIVGKINEEFNDSRRFSRVPAFWNESWKKLPPNEIVRKREEAIVKYLQSSGIYKHLLVNPEKYQIGYTTNQSALENAPNKKTNSGEKLPYRMKIRQTEKELPQQVKEVSFDMEKAVNKTNTVELLKAALKNEKNLYYKMDNFVYDQNLQLQCWKKQKVTESYGLERSIARTQTGETLSENEKSSSNPFKSSGQPSCVLDFETIKSDATNTFWAAPYLDQLKIEFTSFTVLDGIPVARYTVFKPSMEKFNRIAAGYPNIKHFRTFIGTIFISIEDSQIIKFWGTSFPVNDATGYESKKVNGSYGATAIRQKLSSGIWVTTLLNTVAVTNEKNVMKPFSYVVKYQNYRQGTSDFVILDDEPEALSSK